MGKVQMNGLERPRKASTAGGRTAKEELDRKEELGAKPQRFQDRMRTYFI